MNWRGRRIVKIGDKYALRVGWIFYEYKSLSNSAYYWKRDDDCFHLCLANSLAELYQKIYYEQYAKEVVIKWI